MNSCDFPFDIVEELRRLGHDVTTALEDGRANLKIPDDQVLARAIQLLRAVLTHGDSMALAHRIEQAIRSEFPLDNKLVRVRKPSVPQRSTKP